MRGGVLVAMAAGCGRLDFDNASVPGDGSSNLAGDAGPDAMTITSCLELRQDAPGLLDGVYTIDNVTLYCDMTVDGGGWTLVGRSTGDTATPFGWKEATGSVSDDSAPYSLGPLTAGLTFTQILVAAHAGHKVPVNNGYIVPAEPKFVTAYAATSLRSESTTVIGSCAPSPFVTMLLFKGQTDLSGVFWFRDAEFVGGTYHGLFPTGWDTFYPGDCLQGGLLHQSQGVIYVR